MLLSQSISPVQRVILTAAGSLLLGVNWSQQPLSPHYCIGTVITSTGDKKDLVDIKIGPGNLGVNSNIRFYQKPDKPDQDPVESTKYNINLEQIRLIKIDPKKPLYVYTPAKTPAGSNEEPKKFVEVEIATESHGKGASSEKLKALAPENYQLLGKLKNNGIAVFYPLTTLKEIQVENCLEIGEHNKENN